MPFGKKRSASLVEDSDASETAAAPVVKKSKSSGSGNGTAEKDDDGNPFWELSSKRRVGISEFKGANYINIREYYEKDGKKLPGKKGISLSLDQYNALLKLIPSINETLRAKGHTIDDSASDAAAEVPVAAKPSNKPSSKSNIDATSDEESS